MADSLAGESEWEQGLGRTSLAGLRVAVTPNLGSAIVSDGVHAAVETAADELIDHLHMTRVDVDVDLPRTTWEWAVANQVGLYQEVEELWPGCADDMTKSMAFGVRMGLDRFDLEVAARVEAARTDANEAMATLFDQVDLVLCASNPDVAFPAHVESNNRVAGEKVHAGNNGTLTIPANISGNPACSVPAGVVDGLPVGMQIMGAQHEDRLVLDVAAAWERVSKWPLVAPSPR